MMDNQIHLLVNKLIDIFEVERPELGHRWAESLISSVHRSDKFIKPVEISLNEIETIRGDSGVRDLYQQIVRQNDVGDCSREILHLASNLVADNNTRKFIRIHNILRDAKAKKQQKQQEQQHYQQQYQQQQSLFRQQLQPQQHQPQQTPKTQLPAQSHLLQQSQISHQAQITSQALLPPQTQPSQQHLNQTLNSLQLQQNSVQQPPSLPPTPKVGPPQPSSQPPRRHPQTPNAANSPVVGPNGRAVIDPNITCPTITPATQKFRRDKTRRRKNDPLYQKMKTFLTENQFLSFDFKKIDWTQVPPIAPLSSMSTTEQEAALISDLLYVLIGTEGKYIRMQPSRDSPNKHTIGVERGGDELAYTNATRIIKICPLYSTVVHYAEDVNVGLVNQALGAPARELVKEYLSLISNLQFRAFQNDLTLQSMWLALQTIFHRMDALKQILDQISKEPCYGGNTLSVLHNRIVNFSTDARTHEFCLKLMHAASEPYFGILEKWLYLGIIDDPHGEFFVEDTENKNEYSLTNIFNTQRYNPSSPQNIDIDAFWRRRFTRDDTKVPNFLNSKFERIFETGKYLSAIRQYSKKIFRPLPHEPLVYCTEQRKYQEQVDKAYTHANKELLDLLLDQNKLIDRLYSLKRYFLFSCGDLFVQFMDMADEELSKDKDDIDLVRLASLLELALRTSSCSDDPYKDDVQIQMSEGSLYHIMESINNTANIISDAKENRKNDSQSSDTLFGWESLTLSYNVPWPLSMVICKDYCQTLYQMMFRHLFCCKFIERKLEATWKVNQMSRSSQYGNAFALLGHKMLHFVHNLLFYITGIIEPSFQILISKFKEGAIDSVKEVIELHRAFLSGLVHETMLTDNELLGHVTKLLLLCMDFSVVIDASVPKEPSSQNDVFQARILEIDNQFENNIQMLLRALANRGQDSTATNKLQNLIYRLDFNYFYSKDF